MKIYKIASQESDIRDIKRDVDDLEKDVRDILKDHKEMEREIEKLGKAIEDLNIGTRRFYQNQSSLTSLQRKIERFEKVEQEWKNYKKDMDDSVKREVERQFRTQVKV